MKDLMVCNNKVSFARSRRCPSTAIDVQGQAIHYSTTPRIDAGCRRCKREAICLVKYGRLESSRMYLLPEAPRRVLDDVLRGCRKVYRLLKSHGRRQHMRASNSSAECVRCRDTIKPRYHSATVLLYLVSSTYPRLRPVTASCTFHTLSRVTLSPCLTAKGSPIDLPLTIHCA